MQFPTLQLKSPISTSFLFLRLASEILFSIALYSFFRSWLGVLDSWGAYIVPIRRCTFLLSSLMNKVWPISLYSSTWTVIDLSLFSQAINIPPLSLVLSFLNMRSYPSILIVSSYTRCVFTRQMTEGYFSAMISASEFTFDFSPLMLTYGILKDCNALYIFLDLLVFLVFVPPNCLTFFFITLSFGISLY